jgi:sugar fermentation stimulation protein A
MKGCRAFCPNERTHPEFAQALREAADAGVSVLALDCRVTSASLTLDQPVPVFFKMQDVNR